MNDYIVLHLPPFIYDGISIRKDDASGIAVSV
jgi:hypothetical protein